VFENAFIEAFTYLSEENTMTMHIKFGQQLAWSLIRNKKPIVLFERHCHAT
jgi:hypothetical protein